MNSCHNKNIKINIENIKKSYDDIVVLDNMDIKFFKVSF